MQRGQGLALLEEFGVFFEGFYKAEDWAVFGEIWGREGVGIDAFVDHGG